MSAGAGDTSGGSTPPSAGAAAPPPRSSPRLRRAIRIAIVAAVAVVAVLAALALIPLSHSYSDLFESTRGVTVVFMVPTGSQISLSWQSGGYPGSALVYDGNGAALYSIVDTHGGSFAFTTSTSVNSIEVTATGNTTIVVAWSYSHAVV